MLRAFTEDGRTSDVENKHLNIEHLDPLRLIHVRDSSDNNRIIGRRILFSCKNNIITAMKPIIIIGVSIDIDRRKERENKRDRE